jgi:putative DNA-invertase from lambdoid prophage Rac
MSQKREIRRVALYCRVSTGGQSTDMQADELRRMAEARGWQVATVVEEKISGRKLRPARERLIAEAKAGAYDAVMVWKLDRWGRSTADLVSSIRDLDAEFEADGIRERVTAGLRHAQRHGTRSGKPIGRPATVAQRTTEIRALANAGASIAEIARRLKIGYGSAHRVVSAIPARHK